MSSVEEIVSVTGQYELPMDRHLVWGKINDPSTLQQCIKGCDQVCRNTDGTFEAVFNFRMGPFRRQIIAQLEVEPVSPPAQYQLRSILNTSRIGRAKGSANVQLEEIGQGTLLCYQAEITVSGWFAKLGPSFTRTAADRYMQRFFQRFVELASIGDKPAMG